jgi:hypothetical protein
MTYDTSFSEVCNAVMLEAKGKAKGKGGIGWIGWMSEREFV